MDKIILILATILAVSAPSFIYAHEDENKEREKIRIQAMVQNQDDDEDEEENENKFEIKGEISAVTNNSFTVMGQTIMIDPAKVDEFEQKGILEVGKKIKVEGIIIDGTYYATEINVIGTGQGRFKIEIKGLSSSASPTPSGSPNPSLSPSPSGSPAPSASATPTLSPSPSTTFVNLEIKAKGTIEQITLFFQQVLSFLGNLI